jgi:ABC-type uncharacterized transport system substrate-binding protein
MSMEKFRHTIFMATYGTGKEPEMDDTQTRIKNRGTVMTCISAVGIGIMAIVFIVQTSGQAPSKAKAGPVSAYKVLYIMSYHMPWEWTESQFKGFKEALRGVNIEYKAFQMDTKRRSSEEWKEDVAARAKEMIKAWQPNLVLTGDDDAQKYVAKEYVNTDTPFVFTAVNADPAVYGFTGSRNVTGVCEPTHFVQTVSFLKRISPDVHRIAVITDTGKMWGPLIETFKKSEAELPGDVQVTGYYVLNTFDEYKKTVQESQSSVDALGMMGVFEFKDANGVNVPLETVQKWTVENSKLPDFSFWRDRIDKGTLCAVTVSGYAQGYEAGKMARGILTQGKSPASYPFATTDKGIPIMNLARAKKLGVKPDPGILADVEVVASLPE